MCERGRPYVLDCLRNCMELKWVNRKNVHICIQKDYFNNHVVNGEQMYERRSKMDIGGEA